VILLVFSIISLFVHRIKKKDEIRKICYTVPVKPMTERVGIKILFRESLFGEKGTKDYSEVHSGGSI
jgi:hypothetical protein